MCPCFTVRGRGRGCGGACPPACRDTRACKPCTRGPLRAQSLCLGAGAQLPVHACGFAHAAVGGWRASVAPVRGHVSLCIQWWGGVHHSSWPGAPLDSSSGTFSPKKKGHVSAYPSLWCSLASSCRINTATTLRGADVVQNTSPATHTSPCTLGPCSVCRGGTYALQPAPQHCAHCKTGAEPEAGTHGGVWGLLSTSEATPPGQPCCKERVSLQQAPGSPAPEPGSQVG